MSPRLTIFSVFESRLVSESNRNGSHFRPESLVSAEFLVRAEAWQASAISILSQHDGYVIPSGLNHVR